MPHEETSFLAKPLGLITRCVVRRPVATLVAAIVLAVASGVVTTSGLGFRTSRLDLLNPGSGYNRLWLQYLREFAAEDDAVVVVEGDGPQQLQPVLTELAHAIETYPKLFHSVLYKVDLAPLRRKGLHYLRADELAGIDQFVAQQKPFLEGDPHALRLGSLLTRLTHAYQAASRNPEVARGVESEIAQVVHSVRQAIAVDRVARPESSKGVPSDETSQLAQTLNAFDARYLATDDGRLGFILLRLADTGNQFDRGTEAIDKLRGLINQAAARHPNVRIGLTGLPVMENDEMRESAASMWWANLVSTLGVSLVVIACFGGIRHPLLAAAAFLLALAWSFGYITLAVGHLNILSAAFGVILIGLGMDFGIHYVARYVSIKKSIPASDEALEETAKSVGPGIVTGGVTTALAFFTVAFTDFTGVAELGIISGGGVLLCILAAMVVLPAVVYLADRNRRFTRQPELLRIDHALVPLLKWPRLVFWGSVAVTIALGVGVLALRYDHNLLNLQASGLESVELERRILAGHNQSVWYAVSIADTREELLRRQSAFDKLPTVQRTECIVSILPSPTGADAKTPLVARIHERLASLPHRAGNIPIDSPVDFDQALAAVETLFVRIRPDSPTLAAILDLRRVIAKVPAPQLAAIFDGVQRELAQQLLQRLHTLAAASYPEPPQFSDLPPSLVHRFVGRSGKHLLKIYGRGDLWDMENLDRFVHEVKQVDPHATGQPLQTCYASRQMQRAYMLAACYALVAVTIAVLLDFGNLTEAIFALVPMLLGVIQMFGLLGWFNIPLNAANMITLPLLLGIGLDTGVHVVHDYRTQGPNYRIHGSTAISVLITALTTIVGFGSLMIASHQGLASLGRVMTIGATCCLFTSLVTLPALLTWMSRRGQAAQSQATEPIRDVSADGIDLESPPPQPATIRSRTRTAR
jgi:hopanoid biosynthesis associated RND transporter like protein HpnN